ncbi:dipeptidase [Candidatus Desantisbacteria bacterium CG1_02_38_46]|uniref:Dipeptidase n=2 Tax=unclassified Candidatus Desantisiibacteriota TaxID=3106372 RepID=A0A2H9PD02_9BACT|nr:MAG: dipeptidase [Candidatus Desantisbacteria bacterium CG1_02_38_46]PIZ17295.1 MAG: dipeptidase [Candidatus Desantisbacteria bacterium CG_4_10_14_0_8_um_filter_39_17]
MNKIKEEVEQYRNIALNILKPTKLELEQGFELHRNSIVIDAYGFAPRANINIREIQKMIKAGGSYSEIKDLKEKIIMTGVVKNREEKEKFRYIFDTSGVTCIFQNAGEEHSSPLRMLKRLAHYTYVCDKMGDFLKNALTPEDILEAKKSSKHCLYFSCNGVPLLQQWQSTEEELSFIEIFYELGCRMMHLTYNRRNMIGDGCGELSDAGLSDFGKMVVKQMNRVGVIVDVAHSGWQTSIDAAKISSKPIVASHSGCFSITKHYRNKTDKVIKSITDTGGYIGICCIPKFLGGEGNINSFLDHIDYVVKKFGADYVAIGTDVAPPGEDGEKKSLRLPPSRIPWESLWPPAETDFLKNVEKSLMWTNWPLFTVGLCKRGYSDKDIKKIIGGNVMRVAKTVLNK